MLVIDGKQFDLRKIRRNGTRRRLKEEEIARQKLKQYGTCCICDEPLHEYTCTIEHIIPFSKLPDPRKFIPENIEIACSRCNTGKKDKTIGEYQGQWVIRVKRWLKYRIYTQHDIPDRADMVVFLFMTGIRGRILVDFYLGVMEQEKAILITQIWKQPAD